MTLMINLTRRARELRPERLEEWREKFADTAEKINKHENDEVFVLGVCRALLEMTKPLAIDAVGFTLPDAWLFRDIYLRGYEIDLKPENVEWVRRHLLKYEDQIRKIGLDFDRLNKIRIAEKAIYWKTVSQDSKLVNVTIDVKKNAYIIAKYRNYRTRQREFLRADLTRTEAIALFRKYEPKKDVTATGLQITLSDFLEGDEHSTIHVVYLPCPFADTIVKELRGESYAP